MELWTSFALKSRARQLLRGRWVPYLAVTLLFSLIGSLVDELLPLLLPDYNAVIGEFLVLYEEAMLSGNLGMITPGNPLLQKVYLYTGISAAANAVFQVLVLNVLLIGFLRWMMEARLGQPRISMLFSGFFNGAQWRNVAGIGLYTDIIRTLLLMLFLVPGIIYGYRIWLVPYLLAENPYIPRTRAIELSTALTEGEKMRIFMLELSFIGWTFLAGALNGICSLIAPALGTVIGFIFSLFITAYQFTAFAELYAHMREKAFRMGITDPTELAGFAVE